MSTLIICLPPASSAAGSYDYALTPDGRTLSDHARVPLALLPAAQRGRELVAVIPASELSWHSVELPKGINAGSPRLRAILDNLLEDRLLDEPAQLHLALQPGAGSAAPAWVAVCNKGWLRSHLQALEALGRPVGRIVPEFAPETGPLQVHVTGEPGAAFLVATGKSVRGVLQVPFNTLALALLPQPEADENVLVAAEPAVAALAEELLQTKVTLLTPYQRWLDSARSSWDLAQFDLSSSGRARTVKRLSGVGRDLLQAPGLRPVRWGIAVLVLGNLVGLNALAWKEQSALDSKRLAIKDTLTRSFPQVRLVVDAPLQMEREVAALRQATGAASGRDLEAMLAALGGVLPAERSASAIEFAGAEARLKGLRLNAEDLQGISSRLAPLGYGVRLDGEVLVMRQQAGREGTP
jgi:general secretion pathway protein L